MQPNNQLGFNLENYGLTHSTRNTEGFKFVEFEADAAVTTTNTNFWTVNPYT
jgi:hypothetical protein